MLFSSSGSFYNGLPQPVVVTRKKQVRDKVFKYPFRLLVAKKRAEKGKTKAVMPSKMLNEVAESIVPDWAGVLRNVPQAARLLDVNESRKDKAEIFNTFILPNRNISNTAKKFLKKMVNEFTFSDNLEPIDIKTDRSLERYRLMSGGHDLESDLRDGRIIRDRSEPLETIMTRIFSNDRLDQASRSGHSSSELAELIRKVYNTSDDQEKLIDEFLRKNMRKRDAERQTAEASRAASIARQQEQDRINQELSSFRSANSVFAQPSAPYRLDATGRMAFSDTSSEAPADIDRFAFDTSAFDSANSSFSQQSQTRVMMPMTREELEAFNAEEAEAWAQQQREAEQAAEEVGPPPEADQMSQQDILPDALPVASADALIPTVAPATTTPPSVVQEVTEPIITTPAVVENVEPEPVFDEQQVMRDLIKTEQGIDLADFDNDLTPSETDAVAPLADNPDIIQTQEGAANVTGAAQDTNTAVLAAPPQIANSDIPIVEVKPDIDVAESQIAGLPVQNPVKEEALGIEDQPPTGPQAAGAGQQKPLSQIESKVIDETMRDIPSVITAVSEAKETTSKGAPPKIKAMQKVFLKPELANINADEATKFLLRYYAIPDQVQGEYVKNRQGAIQKLIDAKKLKEDDTPIFGRGYGRKEKVETILSTEPDLAKRQELQEYHKAKTDAYVQYSAIAK